MDSLTVEKYYPQVLSLLSSSMVILTKYYNWSTIPIIGENILSSSISIGATWAGFGGTIMGLLLTIPKEKIITGLITSHYIDDLHHYVYRSITSSIVFSFVSLFLFFFENNVDPFGVINAVWLGVCVYAALCFYRASSIIYKVMKLYHRP